MQLTLLCERCKIRNVETKVGVFNYSGVTWPLDLSIFKSWNPELLPDPFPAGMVDDWAWARCRVCGARPFLNIIPQSNGKVMIVTGERVEQGTEGNVLTLEHGYVPIPGYPGQKLKFATIKDEYDLGEGQVVEQLTKDPPHVQQQPKDGPVSCPACGREYVSQANMDRHHKCKKE